MSIYTCDNCGKKTKDHYTYGDRLLCDKCLSDEEDKAENAYDVAKDEGKI